MEDTPKGFPGDFLLVRRDMVDQFLLFNTQQASKSEVESWFYELLNRLKLQGWRRRHVWELIHAVYPVPNLKEEFIDIVGDYEYNLVGFCSINKTDRFPGDPEDLTELNKYVDSGKWKEE